MLASVKGMLITLASTLNGFRAPVTRQYPTTPTPVKPRYMGFPALTWDDKVDEPFCTACMVCIRNCPTQCMSATMKDNPGSRRVRVIAARLSTLSKSTSTAASCAVSASTFAISTPLS